MAVITGAVLAWLGKKALGAIAVSATTAPKSTVAVASLGAVATIAQLHPNMLSPSEIAELALTETALTIAGVGEASSRFIIEALVADTISVEEQMAELAMQMNAEMAKLATANLPTTLSPQIQAVVDAARAQAFVATPRIALPIAPPVFPALRPETEIITGFPVIRLDTTIPVFPAHRPEEVTITGFPAHRPEEATITGFPATTQNPDGDIEISGAGAGTGANDGVAYDPMTRGEPLKNISMKKETSPLVWIEKAKQIHPEIYG